MNKFSLIYSSRLKAKIQNIHFIYILFILIIQNLFIFHGHYFNDMTFPWDFVETYMAVPFYWIEIIRHGYDASWIPFQGMGYPLYMNLQSGYYYLPNWILVLLDIQYTINVAVIMQCIHILFASIGAVVLSYSLGLKWYEALLVGFIYQTFGAFYSNSEHLDIIRGYTFIPWLLLPIVSKLDYKYFNQYLFFLFPFIVFLMWTGGYLGMSISVFFIIFCTMLFRGILDKQYRIIGIYTLLALGIGTLMAFSFLLPSLLDKASFLRSVQIINYDYAFPKDLFGLVFKIAYPSQPHDLSMQSTSIGLITFMLLMISIFNIKSLNKWLVFLAVLSVLMITGLIHHYLIQLLPPLGLSRMIMSDYRGIIGIVLILMAISNLKAIDTKNLFVSFILTLIFSLLGVYSIGLDSLKYTKDLILLFVSLFASVGVLYIYHKKPSIGLPLLFIVLMLDFYRIHSSKFYWSYDKASLYMQKTFGEYGNFTKSLLSKVSGETLRYARIDEEKRPHSYKGYYTGEYLLNDYGGSTHLKQYDSIRNNETLKTFAMMPWTAINGERNKIDTNIVADFVSIRSYKTSKIEYTVNSKKPSSFIENEIYWKGWKGKIIDNSGNIVQEIEPVNIDGFRKWNIPNGEYKLVTNFIPPHEKTALYLSILGIFSWLFFIHYFRKKLNDIDTARI